MPDYNYDKDYPFAAYITNLGKYNEGELVGEWVKFPTTYDELQKVFARIGIGSVDDFGQPYEEWFITDYDCYVDGLADKLGEHEDLDELNYLASKLEEMDRGEYDQFRAAMELGDHAGSLQEIINLTENLDCYEVYPDIEDRDDLGRYYIDELDAMQVPEHLKNYIDYEAYGRDIELEEGGSFTGYGYVRDSGNTFHEYYDGERGSIPEEYRVMSKPGETELTEDERMGWAMDIAFDLDEFFRQRDPQYAAEHPAAQAAKEEIFENLFAGRISALEEKLADMGQTQADYLPSELAKYKDATGYDDRADVFNLAAACDDAFREHTFDYSFMFQEEEAQKQALSDMILQGDTAKIKTALVNMGRAEGVEAEVAPLIARLDALEKERGISTYMVYQIKEGAELRDYRFESLDSLRRSGLSVNPEHYDLIYAAKLSPEQTQEDVYTELNFHLPEDFHGHSLSVSDIVVFREQGKDTAYYCDSVGFVQVPEFLEPVREKEAALATPDELETGETVRTPRGSFHVTAMSREQMETAGYGFHHQSEDGQFHIMANGTRAFAIRSETAPEITEPEKMTVLVVAPMKEPYVKELSGGFRSLQAEVGGSIAAVYPFHDPVALVCHDEGKLIGLDLNRALRDEQGEIYDVVAGSFLVVGLGAEDFTSLSPEFVQKYTEHFKHPELFANINGQIVSVPIEPDNPLRTAEMTLEDDYGMIDGVLINGRRGEEVEKAKEADKKPSIKERLEDAKRECAGRKTPDKAVPQKKPPELGEL